MRLSQVQIAINQLHFLSPTANSFPLHYSHPTSSNSSLRSPSKLNQFQPSKDEDKMTSPSIKSPTDWNLSNTNPTQARAVESDEEDQNKLLTSSFNSLTNHQSIKSCGRSQSTHINLHQSNSHSNLHPFQNCLDPSKLIQPTHLLSNPGVDPRDHSTPFTTVLLMSRELTKTNQSEPSTNSGPIKTSSSFKTI
ncbi:hypothetical protein O181_076052 [Austropuccinia psidii MF-1]|uniref:Uncharacterized protein n=1 Tax=Austropuccinia psidii MF-1 TaxID=1389203 RepID=A0A9Q3IDF5_9BASI|nr:hypothetical protein [Austropuccinia psidii MF-1]